MKKLFSSSLAWAFPCLNSPDRNSQALKERFNSGLITLCRLTTAVLLATVLLGLSQPARGQAVNATLLGTVNDSSGAAVSSAKVTITETKTGITRTSPTND